MSTLALTGAPHVGAANAALCVQGASRMIPKNPTVPTSPQPPSTQPERPLDPDPKSHPIHAPVPTQPIHQGTDPKQPVRRGGDGAS